MIFAKIVIGFVVGVLIGLSGVGGGVLLRPVLIFGLATRVPMLWLRRILYGLLLITGARMLWPQ